MQQQQTYFPGSHEIFSRINYQLSHKSGLNRFKMIKLISNIFSRDNGMNLENNIKIYLIHKHVEIK